MLSQLLEYKDLPSIFLKRGAEKRIKNGHFWVFSNEISEVLKIKPGSFVSLYTYNKDFIGIGYFNPHSLISFRLLGKDKILKPNFIEKRIELARNKRFYSEEESFRIIFSEADYLPGLIVDRYQNHFVIQTLTAGMENLVEDIIFSVDKIFNPATIFLKNDSKVRELEGLPLYNRLVKGKSSNIEAKFLNTFFSFDLEKAQKSGLYLDQRDNLTYLEQFDFKNKVVLDLFSYFGSFGILALKKGAKKVYFVDSSKYSLSVLEDVCRRLKFSNYEVICLDAFDFLGQMIRGEERFDFIFSDPPSFAKSAKEKESAYRGYVRLNERCLRLLKEGGMLVASCCSHHISVERFYESLMEAAIRSKKEARFIHFGKQSLDHPIILKFAESFYLKTFFVIVD